MFDVHVPIGVSGGSGSKCVLSIRRLQVKVATNILNALLAGSCLNATLSMLCPSGKVRLVRAILIPRDRSTRK